MYQRRSVPPQLVPPQFMPTSRTEERSFRNSVHLQDLMYRHQDDLVYIFHRLCSLGEHVVQYFSMEMINLNIRDNVKIDQWSSDFSQWPPQYRRYSTDPQNIHFRHLHDIAYLIEDVTKHFKLDEFLSELLLTVDTWQNEIKTNYPIYQLPK